MTLEAEGLEERRNILLKYLKNEMPDGIPDRASFFDVFLPVHTKKHLKIQLFECIKVFASNKIAPLAIEIKPRKFKVFGAFSYNSLCFYSVYCGIYHERSKCSLI